MSLLDYCHSYSYPCIFIKRCFTVLKLHTIIAKRIDQTNTFSIRLKCSWCIYLHDISIFFVLYRWYWYGGIPPTFSNWYIIKTLILLIEPFWLKIDLFILVKNHIGDEIRLTENEDYFIRFMKLKKVYITLHIK